MLHSYDFTVHLEDLLLANSFNYLIKLRTMFEFWKIPPVSRSNGKQNIQFQNKTDWQ